MTKLIIYTSVNWIIHRIQVQNYKEETIPKIVFIIGYFKNNPLEIKNKFKILEAISDLELLANSVIDYNTINLYLSDIRDCTYHISEVNKKDVIFVVRKFIRNGGNYL